MNNFANGPEIPTGLGMALAQNNSAMQVFSGLSDERREQIIAHTKTIRSKEEMQSYVNTLSGGNTIG